MGLVQATLTEWEHEKLREMAETDGRSMSMVLRDALVNEYLRRGAREKERLEKLALFDAVAKASAP